MPTIRYAIGWSRHVPRTVLPLVYFRCSHGNVEASRNSWNRLHYVTTLVTKLLEVTADG
jgi:hypothetical protein